MSQRPIVRPGDRGPQVAALFQALEEHGFFVSAHDRATNTYAESVARVRDFQVKHHLAVDGIVGPKTWAALDAAPDAEPPVGEVIDTSGLEPFTARLIDVAQAEYRKPVLEDPWGWNRGPDVDKYLLGHRHDGDWLVHFERQPNGEFKGANWCARFALWVVEEAALQLSLPSPVAGWGDLASSAKWVAQAHRHNRLEREPMAGDIGCILTGDHGHVVLVARLLESGKLLTVEGNSGQRVALHERDRSEFDAFVNVTP